MVYRYYTAFCRIYTIDYTELLFYGSHTTCKEKGPIFNFEFEDAVISYGEFSDKITATDRKGNKKSYGSPEDDFQFFKLFQAVEHVNNPGSIICGPEAASSQTLCANGMQEFMPNISVIGGNLVQKDIKENRLWIKGLDEILTDCYQKNILPGEANISWAKKEKPLNLKEYCYFPEGKLPNNQE